MTSNWKHVIMNYNILYAKENGEKNKDTIINN